MNIFALIGNRLQRRRQPDFCALVEGAVTMARTTEDPKALLANVADRMGRALELPRLVILLNNGGVWNNASEYSQSGLTATARENLRSIEPELLNEFARAKTAPSEITIAGLKPDLRSSLEKAFEDAPVNMRAERLVFVPICEGTTATGAILFYRPRHPRLSDMERHALQTLASALSFALHHLQSRGIARDAAQREELTHQLLAAIRNAGSIDEILKAAVDGLGETLSLSRIVIFKGEGDEQAVLSRLSKPLTARAEYRQSALVPTLLGSSLDLDDTSLLGQLMADEIIVIHDTSDSDVMVRALCVRLGVRALVLAPILYQGDLIAVLALEQFDNPRHFTSEELRLTRLVAEQTAAAIDKARLYREAQENARREAFIRRINSAIHSSLDVDDILQTIVDELGTALGVCRCRLGMLPNPLPETFPITHEYVAGCCKHRQAALLSVPTPGNTVLQSLMALPSPIIFEDPANDRRMGDLRDRYREAEVKSLLLASIRYGGRPIGIFSLYHCEQAHKWTQNEIDIVRSVVEQAAVALRQSELYKEVRESATRGALVNQIVASIRRSLDLEQTLAVAVEEVGRALGTDRTNFRQIIGNQAVVVAESLSNSALSLKDVPEDADDFVMQELRRTKRTLVFDDVQAFINANPQIADGVRVWHIEHVAKSAIVCPIFVNDALWGTLALAQTDCQRKWGSNEVAMVEEVCAQVEVAVSHSRLFEETRQAAERAALISEIIHGINQSNYLDEIFPIVAKQLGKHLAADRVTITRRQGNNNWWVTECEYSNGQINRTQTTFKDEDIAELAELLDGDMARCDDAEHDLRLSDNTTALLRHMGTRSFMSASVQFDGESQLAISAIMCSGPRRWADEEMEVLRAVANQIRVALQRASLFDMVSQGKYEWEATFDALTDGLYIFDEHGTLRRVNQTGAILADSNVQSLIGRKCCTLLQGIEGEVCQVSQVIQTNRPLTFELTPERLQRPVLVTIAPLETGSGSHLDGGNSPRGAVCIVRELSELRAAEAIAREQRNYLVKLIEHANDSIFALSPDGYFTWFNEQLVKQSGFPRDTLKRVTYLDCVPESEKPQMAERFRRAMAGAAQTFEVRTFRRNSESRLMLMTFTPIYDAGGVTSILSIARDITEERLASERAAQAEKLRALGQLASGVAHNFNNILAAILGHAQLMKRESSDESMTARLDIIEKAALDGAQTVKRIQGFGLPPGNEAYETFDVNQLLQDSTTLTRARWQHEAQARGLAYDVALDLHDVPVVRGAASELREVFVNMILNALDAMPQGGQLRIASKQKAGKVLVTFSDTGLGMTREVRQRIFEPFFTTKGVTGMGLGLAVSYSIVERHGGEIDVRSVLGRGTTFTVILPASRDHHKASESSDAVMAKTARVLVVDDDDRVRDVLVGMLKLAGHRADHVTNGREALTRLEHEPFDLVFTDLSMPDVDGWALAEEIRRRWPQLKIVMVTGYASQTDSDRQRRKLVNDVISKPIRFDDISTTLSQVLS